MYEKFKLSELAAKWRGNKNSDGSEFDPNKCVTTYAVEEIADYKVFVVMPVASNLVGLVFCAKEDYTALPFDTEKSISLGCDRLWLRYNKNFAVSDYARLLMATEHHDYVPHDVKKVLKRSHGIINFRSPVKRAVMYRKK